MCDTIRDYYRGGVGQRRGVVEECIGKGVMGDALGNARWSS
jgi:hypothetical protein